MRKFYLRLWFWWNDICPEHGRFEGGRLSSYCIPCVRALARRKDKIIDDRMNEWPKL